MQFSNHAIARGQQRGISAHIVDLIIRNGQPGRKEGNALEYKIKNRDLARLISNHKHEIHLLEKARNKAVLVSDEGDWVITVYHEYK